VVKSSLDHCLGLFDPIGMKASCSGDEALEGLPRLQGKTLT
jgi:hypothetical protein